MKVLLLGATGRTGRHILQILLKKGHKVNVIIRDKSKLEFYLEKVVIFEGDTTNAGMLRNAMAGCEAVISALNISRISDFPWAKLRTPKTFLSDTMLNLIKTAEELAVKKIIICSAWGVHETNKDLPGWFRWLIRNSNIGVAYKDHERQEDLLRNSTLDFTIVRPVGLINSLRDKTTQISINNLPKPKLLISRKAVADFIVGQLNDSTYSKRAVTISQG